MSWRLPRFEKEMKKFDPMLRIRRSVLEPWFYLIERKAARESKCLILPKERRGMDNWIRDKDGYVSVMKVHHTNLGKQVFLELRANDMWEHRGAGFYADKLEEEERRKAEALEKEQRTEVVNLAEMAYDQQMIKQGDVVSNFHPKEANA